MGSKQVWSLGLLLIFVSLEGSFNEGCREEERVALLQVKPFFNGPYEPLSTWVEGEPNSNCCQWKYVECNNNTSRVIGLRFDQIRDWDSREWYLNASLFSAFEELQKLDLSVNSIAGFIENEGLDKLSSLRNLEYLDLGRNVFNNDILLSLDAISSLKKLYLYSNKLNGTVDLRGLGSLNNLQDLDLSYNEIEKIIPQGLDRVSSLSNLEYLDLGHNLFNNDILLSLNALSSLKKLHLYGNKLHGTVDLQGLGSLNNLQDLDLRYNGIKTIILQGLVLRLDNYVTCLVLRVDNLKRLDLSHNMPNDGEILSCPLSFSSIVSNNPRASRST